MSELEEIALRVQLAEIQRHLEALEREQLNLAFQVELLRAVQGPRRKSRFAKAVLRMERVR